MDTTKFWQSVGKFFKWLGSVWSEPDGNGSSTRVHMSALIAFVLGVGVSFSVLVHKQHITLEQFDAFLNAGATFLVTTTGSLYGINKMADWASTKQQNGNGTPPVPPAGQ